MLENAINYLIRNNTGVRALVTDDKAIAFSLMPTGAIMPGVVIHAIVSVPVIDLDATSNLVERRVQFDCYASDYITSRKLAEAVKAAITDLSGPLNNGDSPMTQTVVQTSYINSDFDMPYEQGGAGKGFVYRAVIDASFWFQQ
jgi:hypothetical protein